MAEIKAANALNPLLLLLLRINTPATSMFERLLADEYKK